MEKQAIKTLFPFSFHRCFEHDHPIFFNYLHFKTIDETMFCETLQKNYKFCFYLWYVMFSVSKKKISFRHGRVIVSVM